MPNVTMCPFSAAAAWLARSTYNDIASVYLFCRTVDDLADETGDGEALDRLAGELRGRLEPRWLTGRMIDLRAKGVDLDAAVELIEGCRWDTRAPVRVADRKALLRYAYLVAGTVGRMVAPLLGASDPRAMPHAVGLGMAMQLTNIARDVGEDAVRGRVYLPATWLSDEGIDAGTVLRGDRDEAVARVVERLLQEAEVHYRRADGGLRYLPLRGRLAVALASRRYRAIGRKVGRLGVRAVRQRTVLTVWQTAAWAMCAPWTAFWYSTPWRRRSAAAHGGERA